MSQRSDSKRRSIVMLATEPQGCGGVAAVISGYQSMGLQERCQIQYIATHCDGGRGRKALIACRGLWRCLRMLVRGEVALAHVHTASRSSFLRKSVFVSMIRLFRVPVIIHIHGAEFDQFYLKESGRLGRWWIRTVLGKAERVLVLSEHWRRFLCRLVPAERVVTLVNGVTLAAPAGEAAARRRLVVLFLGQIGERKGFFDLLEAFARLCAKGYDIELRAGGDGDLDRARREIDRLGLGERVRLLGWVAGAAKETALRQADLFCLPSHAEGLPMALLEAMGAGVPVVTTPVGGIPEAVADGETGVLVPPGDTAALEAALEGLLGDAERRQAIGAAGRRRVEQQFSLPAVLRRLEEVYLDLGVAGRPAAESRPEATRVEP